MSEPHPAPPSDGASKARLEMLTDGVFAIVMTLLVLDIRLPDEGIANNAQLWEKLGHLAPEFVSYAISFAVLAMFWIMHHMFVHLAVKVVDRALLLINTTYLALLALVPFSARVLAAHLWLSGAVVLYGLNIFGIGLCSLWMFSHVMGHPELSAGTFTGAMHKRAQLRNVIVPLSAALGMLSASVWIPLALFLYAFPVVFNLVPGLLGAIERLLGIGVKKTVKARERPTPAKAAVKGRSSGDA